MGPEQPPVTPEPDDQMPPGRIVGPRNGWKGRRGGFTLIELLLVTVILGLLAGIVAPYFSAARERAIAAQMRAELRNLKDGIETYIIMNDGLFPASLEALEDGSTYNPTTEIEYCVFQAVPPSAARDGYVIALVAHPGTTQKMFVVYPLWGDRVLDYDSGARGC